MDAPFWEALPPRLQVALRRTGTVVIKRAGEFLVRQDAPCRQVFVIRDGAVKAWATNGDDVTVFDVLGAGDSVGELEAVDGALRQANVTALRRTEVLALTLPAFHNLASTEPQLLAMVAAVLSERLRDANELRMAHKPDAPARRLSSRLLRLASRFAVHNPDGWITLDVPLSQEDLSRWAGTSRAFVSRAFAEQRHRGDLTFERHTISVRSLAVLHRIGETGT